MAFCESEMTPRGVIYGDRGRVDLPLHSAPITAKENMRKALHEGKVLFMPNSRHNINFNPRVLPDIEARGMALDGGEPLTHPEGFKDMFGLTWKFIAKARGAMVEPGTPLLGDMNAWEEKVVWPDIESWDWEKQNSLYMPFLWQQ